MEWSRKRKVGASVAILAVAGSCSTLSLDKVNDPALSLCNGKAARKSFEFVISSYVRLPSGLPVSEASKYQSARSREVEEMVNEFVPHLLAEYATPDGDHFTKKATPLLERYQDLRLKGTYLIRTGAFSFAACDPSSCAGLQDPITRKQIEVHEHDQSNYSGGGLCREYYVSDVDKEVCSARPWDNKANCPSSNYSFWKFVSDTGFNAGRFFAEHYFSTPEREMGSFCKKAQLKEECFSFPESQVALRATESYLQENGRVVAATKLRELTNRCTLTSWTSTAAENACFQELAKDGEVQRLWVDAMTRDLLLKATVKISKKIEGSWVISRITWDPSLVCRYAKSDSDLYTQ